MGTPVSTAGFGEVEDALWECRTVGRDGGVGGGEGVLLGGETLVWKAEEASKTCQGASLDAGPLLDYRGTFDTGSRCSEGWI
jgi:hypothetical protein